MLQIRPTRRMLHDVIISVPIFRPQNTKNLFVFQYILPPEGNFDIDAGDGGGANNPKTINKQTQNIKSKMNIP